MIGRSIAHYKVTAKIGAGGMGEVWRATDTKLSRDVALKILPEIFSADPERMARFAREAQLLASLSHPNIAAIYGVEEFGGRRALVLELVEGQDLHQRLAAGPLPLDETLEIARQIAEALEAAHERGVVHRDLKPANVKLAADGGVKVLDFGLAKALEGEPAAGPASSQSLSPTLTAAATQAGVVLGTAAYMSPEQARGKRTDRRSDIFSFGTVLFEMLARRSCFGGETVSDTLAAVIKDDVEWERLPADLPVAVRHLLRRCLEKDPKQRLQSIGEARIALSAVLSGDAGTLGPVPGDTPAAAGKQPARSRLATWTLAALATGAAAVAGWWVGSSGNAPLAMRFALEPPGLAAQWDDSPILSPDGRRIAYVAGGDLWIRDLDSLNPRRVSGGGGGRAPCWSPDGSWLAFAQGRAIRRVAAGGGEPSIVSTLPFQEPLGGIAWGAEDSIYLAPQAGPIHRVSALGGDPVPFLEPDYEKETDFHLPHALPGGRGLLYTVHRNEGIDTLEIFAGGSRRVLLRLEGERLEHPVYSTSGHVLYERRGGNAGVWALPFSLSSLEAAGEPFLLAAGAQSPSVSRDGTLVYAEPGDQDRTELVWIGGDGEHLGPAGPEMPGLVWPEISEDGRRVMAGARVEGNRDIWMLDLERGTWSRITFDERVEWQAAWHPDGERVLVSEGTPGRFRTRLHSPASGTGVELFIAKGAVPAIDSEPGLVFYTAVHRETGFDLMVMPLDGQGEGRPLVATPALEAAGAVSPDGRYLAYQSDESGRNEVYVVELPEGTGKRQVSAAGGWWPRWSRGRDEILFLTSGEEPALMAVSFETDPALRLGVPRRLFGRAEHPDLDWDNRGPARQYDVSSDGERFLMVRKIAGEDTKKPRAIVIQRWTEALAKGEE